MKYLDTDFVHICILDEHTVLVEAMAEVEIDLEKSTYANTLISESMDGNYGMIIHRKEDYSIVPVDVYNVLNKFPKLRAIAIVTNRKVVLPESMERELFNGNLEYFETIKEAHEWVSKSL